MSPVLAGVLQLLALTAALALAHVPLGNYLARVYSSPKHLRIEKWIYKSIGADPDTEMRWPAYLRGVLAFSLAGVLFLYLLQRLQGVLPGSLGFASIDPDQAFNTAASFVANTNWQSYYGEQAMGHVVQTAGLAVQNFVSAAVGIAVAVALVRGFARSRTGELGNFWADLVRGVVRVLVPIAAVGAVILVACGVIQNFSGIHEVGQFMGGTQEWNGGAVASQEVIKELGTNGGGYFNANSAHPFENPTPFTNLFEIFLILLIPVALTRTFGIMTGSVRQGYAILGTMAAIWAGFVALMMWTEFAHHGPALQAAGGAMEGKELRFGIGGSSLFAVTTTLTSTGAVDSFHSSYTGLGGGITMLGMMLGEIAPGGVGSGLYGMLVMAVVAVFIAGLMVGRTPEYLGKKIGTREIKFAACYILITPALVLVFTAAAMALPTPGDSMTNSGAHGFSEILYAYTSASNNNGSAFAGLNADTQWFNSTLGLAMLLGRFVPMVFVLALAGSLARQQPVPATAGTLRTEKPLFAGLLAGAVLIITGLTYFPALALGPLAEGLAA
ncbi:potassium-transporting ATPase subunit KdpA [Streptomyces violaceoruber]|uniref:Potassium-transporting ATPase potassium-binding subunit n=1 Tax=Streptomyces coelicolor (strain ATCC BAA-471 / A3(2) / M145) TaxID=100226 RepID=KDPA_STRCO|nr:MULTISPECIES: potassium-transporting ATPase subunit KdpA [Streptomyces]Q9X900.1 RecName: Full=Potassium-transporting ATPase potassium-binding subunit; AltName: Full=ATP phosphohydrolase [potassium-transporting] A chain; AltName: Full=Potassium-binding and translocating subunit A; AltName: Full=Potassium-translocating ATPase A chain [Streptomyces coelicolor A3(2)]MDX2924517.1 potassium-transporting ATPase subunit KdpA [Streptomyces sp. NRRL_B-16638]MDX3365750.1 potassium-transporting ATPase su